MNADLLGRYIAALSNLYGVVPEKKVVEIYNFHNSPKANLGDLEMSILGMNLSRYLVTRKAGYFIKDYLIFEDRYLKLLEMQDGRDYYIPGPEEILEYEDEFYFQKTKEFKDFELCMSECFDLDPSTQKKVTEDLMMDCQLGFDMKKTLDELSSKKIGFESLEDMNNFMKAFQKICSNSRKWQYKGNTYNEIRKKGRFSNPIDHLKRLLNPK